MPTRSTENWDEVEGNDDLVHIANTYGQPLDTTLVVAVDGACRDNGRDNARAGYGIYFGEDSDYNECGRLTSRDTSQRAELVAAIRALNVSMKVIRHEMDGGKLDWQGELYIKTDSQYLAKGATKWVNKWKTTDWLNAANQPVANKELWCQLLHRIGILERKYGVDVIFWWVNRELNTEADRLACEGADDDY